MKTPKSINSGNGILAAMMCRKRYATTLKAIQTKATKIFSICYDNMRQPAKENS